MKLTRLLPITIIISSFIVALFSFPLLPDTLASHWGMYGQVDGYTSKTFGVLFMPILSVVMYVLFLVLPKIDPYKKNFSQFKNHFHNFTVVILSFLFYIYLLTIIWNLGYRFSMIQFMSPGLAAIFYYAGVLVSVAKRNWFVGIRTPWTMSSDLVWDKTHVLGGKLFKAVGAISLLGLPFPDLAVYFVMIPVIFVTVFIFLYSLWEYKKL